MAINLTAVFKVKDNGTSQLRKIERQMERNKRAVDELARSSEKSARAIRRVSSTFTDAQGRLRNADGTFRKTTGSLSGLLGGFKGLGGGLMSIVSKLNPVALGIGAIGAAAAGAYASVKIFNATVGEAMKMQQSQVVISAMFNDKQLSKDYMRMMDELAINSPMLDSQAMYGNSKSYVALSKNNKQLKEMWKLTERLMASDPAQGVEGAVFALRELFSGDAISIVERFELSRDVMNDIKKMDLDDQLKALDTYFNKLGYTEKLIADMGGTALGKWTQVKERIQLIMRDMGTPALDAVGTFLNNALDRLEGAPMQKFAEWGGKAISSVVTGLSNNAIKIYDWFTALTASEEFKSKSTLTGKINFIIEDIADKFNAWWTGGGEQKIIAFGSTVAGVLVSALDATDEVFVLGAKLGNSVWQGVLEGVKKSATESPVGKYLNINGKMLKYTQPGVGFINYGKDAYSAYKSAGKKKKEKSHYHGIDNVPYDGYSARLHKGERVMTAQENKEYSQSGGSNGFGGGQVVITGNNFTVREEADIEKIADVIATEIERRRR